MKRKHIEVVSWLLWLVGLAGLITMAAIISKYAAWFFIVGVGWGYLLKAKADHTEEMLRTKTSSQPVLTYSDFDSNYATENYYSLDVLESAVRRGKVLVASIHVDATCQPAEVPRIVITYDLLDLRGREDVG